MVWEADAIDDTLIMGIIGIVGTAGSAAINQFLVARTRNMQQEHDLKRDEIQWERDKADENRKAKLDACIEALERMFKHPKSALKLGFYKTKVAGMSSERIDAFMESIYNAKLEEEKRIRSEEERNRNATEQTKQEH